MTDPINNPSHYTQGGIETIEYIKAKLTREEFFGFLRANVIKYVSRAREKENELQDYKKAQWYLNRVVFELEGDGENGESITI